MNKTRQKKSKKGIYFFSGFFSGIIFIAIIAAAGGLYLMRNPELIKKQVYHSGGRIISRSMQSLPKDYLNEKQDEIIDLANQFIRAYSSDKLTSHDMDNISQAVFTAAADQKITPREADQLMALVKEVVNR